MASESNIVLERDSYMQPFTHQVADYCAPFSCKDKDLDEFFSEDTFHYEAELLGKTYAWISRPTLLKF